MGKAQSLFHYLYSSRVLHVNNPIRAVYSFWTSNDVGTLTTLNKSLYVVGTRDFELTFMTEEKENVNFSSKALNAILDSVFLTNLVLFILLYLGTLVLFLVGYYILEI